MDFLKKKIFFLELVILYTRILFWLFFHGSVKGIRQEKKKRRGRIKEDLVTADLECTFLSLIFDNSTTTPSYNHEYCTQFCSRHIQRTK